MEGDFRADRADGDLYRRFRAPLFAYFFKRIHNHAEAEDLTQEAFLRLTRSPDRQDGTKLSSYVFTIAANLLRDRARANLARQQDCHRNFEKIDDENDPGPVEDRTPERVLLAKDTLRDVIGALGELSERTRDIFMLSRLEHMPQREIATLHDISVSAVEKHLIKALSHLASRGLRS